MIKRVARLAREDSLAGKSFRSAFWTITGFGSQSVLRLGSNLILTRLLAPDAFGLMALALVFLNGLVLMSDIGTRHSVVRSERGDDPAFLQTAWTIQVLRGFAIAAIALIIAWPAALLYDAPELFPVLCALAAVPTANGFQSISVATSSRKMNIAKQTLVTLMSQVVTISTMITVAWYAPSVWALVIGTILGATINTILGHFILQPFKHRFRFEPAAFKELITFGRWVLISTMCTFLGGRGITLIHGALVPIGVLGVLAISTTLIRALEDLVNKLTQMVVYPAISETLRDRPENLMAVLTRSRWILLLCSTTVFLAVAYLSQPLIDFLYTAEYALAGSFLAIQALNGAVRVLAAPYQNVVLAKGNSRLHAVVMFCSALLSILGTIAGFYLIGIQGMLLGMGAAAFFVFGFSAWLAHKRGFADLKLDAAIVILMLAAYAVVLAQPIPS